MKLRFESTDGEKIYGMGQYQQSYLDLKGLYLRACVAQFTDFYPICGVQSRLWLLWNHPGVGNVVFGRNYTEWEAKAAKQLDYWITVDDNPAKILQNYTEVTGRTPAIDKGASRTLAMQAALPDAGGSAWRGKENTRNWELRLM